MRRTDARRCINPLTWIFAAGESATIMNNCHWLLYPRWLRDKSIASTRETNHPEIRWISVSSTIRSALRREESVTSQRKMLILRPRCCTAADERSVSPKISVLLEREPEYPVTTRTRGPRLIARPRRAVVERKRPTNEQTIGAIVGEKNEDEEAWFFFEIQRNADRW